MQDLLRVNGKDRKVMIGWSEGEQAELKDLTRFLILLSFFIYRQLTFKQYDPCSIDWAPVGCFRRPPGEPPGTTQTLTRIILPQNEQSDILPSQISCPCRGAIIHNCVKLDETVAVSKNRVFKS